MVPTPIQDALGCQRDRRRANTLPRSTQTRARNGARIALIGKIAKDFLVDISRLGAAKLGVDRSHLRERLGGHRWRDRAIARHDFSISLDGCGEVAVDQLSIHGGLQQHVGRIVRTGVGALRHRDGRGEGDLGQDSECGVAHINLRRGL